MWGLPVLGCVLLTSAVLLRRWPFPALAVVVGGSVVSVTIQPRLAIAALGACAVGLEICYVAATRPRKGSVIGAAMAAVGLLIPFLTVHSLGAFRVGRVGPDGPPTVTIVLPLLAIVAWLIGHSIRQAQTQADLERAQAATQIDMARRLRIARELHDIVAHSIGIIAIQAGAGRRVFDARPDQARDALATIETASRDTLSGLRRMVTGLRRAEPEPGPEHAPLGPSPGLADIPQLAALIQNAGVTIDVDWRGSREQLPVDIDLAALRIVQEAVTNVVRHAGTGQCRVCINQQDGLLSIEVTDDGPGASTAGTGYGITGMRERAALLGGDLAAGPLPGGGFRVTARLPVPAPAR